MRPEPNARTQRGARADRTGRAAESAAREALIRDGWMILGERVRTQAGELDLIAEKEALLAFVEVKARPSLSAAAHALTPRQAQRLMGAAEAWMAAHPGHGARGIRFDVLLVAADFTIRRITDALRQE